ncbi:glycosyltransferase involved in cell wall biosynthesis [Sinomonas atrocyanea]|uniref:glycosyltransferase family A protein n=1 Tax=Sinomonas atrocyanea TaxID=37927 RepID=UPI002781D46D|nr:glycosyltransferase family A protein [Sinomonas atrocyanea]MDP9883344.1 glycosyltransferase involved in cell wall biosynthesis [Sinomonas atrocyanea]
MAVVVPCYNYGRYLGDCVSSVTRQRGVSATVHIIDDASTDGSIRIAEELADRNRNVSVTEHDKNIGHIETYNEGLRQVDSDYLVLLSADDILPPGSLARATSLMEHHPAVGLTYGHPQAFTELPAPSPARARSWSVWHGGKWIDMQFRRALGIISSPEAVVRTSVQHRVGYYNPDLPHSADLEMWLRIADVASVGRVNGPDQAYRRIHDMSMMTTNYGTLLRDLVERRKAYDSFLQRSLLPEEIRSELKRKVYLRMSDEAFEWAAEVASRDRSTTADVAEAVELARQLNPGYRSSYAYRDYVWTSAAPEAGKDVREIPAVIAGRITRTLGPRVRWRRWRRFGY